MGLTAALTRSFGQQILTFKKQSPHIFFAAGVVGSVASTVLACKATLNLSKTLDDIKEELETVKELKKNGDKKLKESLEKKTFDRSYSADEYDRDVIYIYAKGAFTLTKMYAPSLLLGAVSITALTGSHVQMSRRNTALMAAYSAVQEAYNNYRDRVRDQLGEERELEIYHAIDTKIVKDDNGVKKEIKSGDPSRWSPYARMFDEYNNNWHRDPELNRFFLQAQQNYYNQVLRSRGHVFLNEIYDNLGFERTKPGAVVGWIIGHDGDNFIDFGIVEAYNSRFINGDEPSIILDFNVDGVIYDKI